MNCKQWIQNEIDDIMDSYDSDFHGAIAHIIDMLEENQDSYSDITGKNKQKILSILYSMKRKRQLTRK